MRQIMYAHRSLRLRRGTSEFRLTQEALSPFRAAQPADGLTHLDLETRSLLQALYYVSHGVEVPDAHRARGLVTITRDATGTALPTVNSSEFCRLKKQCRWQKMQDLTWLRSRQPQNRLFVKEWIMENTDILRKKF